MRFPQRSCDRCEIAPGVEALVPGMAWLPRSRVLIAADVHFAYEEVVGGALPLWSTAELGRTIAFAAERCGAREVVFLGDVIHGSSMSDGAAAAVGDALAAVRAHASVVLVAGNHEGRTRGRRVLGESVETLERDGWTLVHGDRPAQRGSATIMGHLHPSLRLGGGADAPAFLAGDRLVVVPALTPYSSGLDVFSDGMNSALRAWDASRAGMHVVAVTAERLYPFGALAALREFATSKHTRGSGFRRKVLRPD